MSDVNVSIVISTAVINICSCFVGRFLVLLIFLFHFIFIIYLYIYLFIYYLFIYCLFIYLFIYLIIYFFVLFRFVNIGTFALLKNVASPTPSARFQPHFMTAIEKYGLLPVSAICRKLKML